tara:strand:+ start:835 stop:987 length:153 start_codon:yes stop_codon:yes gene_type:complete
MKDLIKDMVITAYLDKNTDSISFLTQLCLDHGIPISTIDSWINTVKNSSP